MRGEDNMISRYRFALNGDFLPSERAYAFYSCLLSMLPFDVAEQLHGQGETPISQFLYFDREKEKNIWQISILDAETADAVCPILDELSCLELNRGKVELSLQEKLQFTAEDFVVRSREKSARHWETLFLLSPMAFKQNGRYVIVPQEHLIIQSLLNKWNTAFPQYPLDDEDALRLLEDGIHISDYSLRSVRFPLKDNSIPGCAGKITLEAGLSAPIMEIWNLLLSFAPFSGVGIKTALGMGGIEEKNVIASKHT